MRLEREHVKWGFGGLHLSHVILFPFSFIHFIHLIITKRVYFKKYRGGGGGGGDIWSTADFVRFPAGKEIISL